MSDFGMNDPVWWILAAGSVALALTTLIGEAMAISGFPLPPEDRRIGCIDGLRGYLAMLVMVYHFAIWTEFMRFGSPWQPPSPNVLAQCGAGAVGLFFMTTGLVFYPRVRAGLAACNWGAIFVSRFFRLVPAVASSIAIIVIVIMGRTGHYPGIHDVRPVLTWLAANGEPPLLGFRGTARINAGVLWSLHFEWLFYLLVLPGCALAADLIRHLRLPSWLVPAGLLGLGLACALWVQPSSILFYLPCFAVGMLAYEAQTNDTIVLRMRGRGMSVLSGIALAAGMILFGTPYGFALPLFGLFFVAVACGNDLFGALRTRGALVLGECSFSIYLLHGIVLDVLFTEFKPVLDRLALPSACLALLAAAAAVVLLACASFLCVERPAIKLGKQAARGMRLRR